MDRTALAVQSVKAGEELPRVRPARSLDTLAAAVGVELGVEMLDVGLDGVDRHIQLARDLLIGGVGRQVAQDPELALAQRFGQARRLRIWRFRVYLDRAELRAAGLSE